MRLFRQPPLPLYFMGVLIILLSAVSCVPGFRTEDDGTSPTSITTELPPPTQRTTITANLSASDPSALANLYARTNPSIVNVTISELVQDQLISQGSGSGFVFDQSGNIVTNDHVIRGSDHIDVTFSDGTVKDAEVIGRDPHSDLAVIKVDKLPTGVRLLPLGEMTSLAVGQTVVAIGNPFGLDGTLTLGIISALGRNIPTVTQFSVPQAIQTDAAINPGNSGGPLLDMQGRVIGVTAQIKTGGNSRTNSGVGFAIPVSIVNRVIPVLIKDGRYEWSWMGMLGSSLTPTLADAMDLSVEKGAYIIDVTRSGPADQAGLRGAEEVISINGHQLEVGGDVITAINGQDVESIDDLLIYLATDTEPGQVIMLTVLRNDEFHEARLSLRARPVRLTR